LGGNVKKEVDKYKFIELRAMGFTYEKICNQLKITKPTAIKWGKLLSSEINQGQKVLISKIFSQRIMEEEQGIMINLEQFKRIGGMTLPQRIKDKFDKKILKKLEKIFIKKISAIHLKIKADDIAAATFIFDDDVRIKD